MGFTRFFERLLGGKKAEQESGEVQQRLQQIRKIDLDVAIAAHKNWCIRLQAMLDGVERDVPSPKEVSCDRSCDLGRWIHGPGAAAFGEAAAFAELKATHQMFHYSASNVILLAQSNKQADARALLEDEVDKLSRRVELSLIDLKRSLQTV